MHTIQRLHSMLQGDRAFDVDLDEPSAYELASSAPLEVAYSAAVPLEQVAAKCASVETSLRQRRCARTT